MRKGIKVLFLADINSAHIERWYHQLVENNIEVGIFSLNRRKASWTEAIPKDNVHCIDMEVSNAKSKWKYFFNQKELRTFVKKFGPDIVHAHYASSYGMLAHRLKFPNTIVSMWGSDVYEFPKRSIIHRIIFKTIIKNSKVVCSTSQDMVREARLYVKRDYELVPFGIDTDFFIPSNEIPERSFTIGTVKSLENVYGIDRLLRSFAYYSNLHENMNAKLVIYGKGSELEELIELGKKLNIDDKVEFSGFVESDKLAAAYGSLDVYAALSRRESFGVAILEAQSCGVPVVVSNVGGLPEVTSRDGGFVVDGEDVQTISENINALTNPDLRQQMGKKGREFVIENYSIKASTEKMLAVYDKLICYTAE